MNTEKIGNYSPEFRLQCEARQVLKWAKPAREKFYVKVLENRGQKAVEELISEVKLQYALQLREKESEHSL